MIVSSEEVKRTPERREGRTEIRGGGQEEERGKKRGERCVMRGEDEMKSVKGRR